MDFGLATSIDDPSYIFVRCGTPGFVAPETLKIKDIANVRIGVEGDMFSLGAIFYQILFGKYLFNGKDQIEVLQNNKMCKIKMQDRSDAAYG